MQVRNSSSKRDRSIGGKRSVRSRMRRRHSGSSSSLSQATIPARSRVDSAKATRWTSVTVRYTWSGSRMTAGPLRGIAIDTCVSSAFGVARMTSRGLFA